MVRWTRIAVTVGARLGKQHRTGALFVILRHVFGRVF
jgi:hypothetical protein